MPASIVLGARTPDLTTFLPTEVLLHIFKFVSQQYLNPTSICTLSSSYEIPGLITTEKGKYVRWISEYKDIRDPTLFPYGLANVCQRWYNAMQVYPEWWSRVRVFMDAGTPAFILSDFRRKIELTQRVQPLQILITNQNEGEQLESDVEHGLIRDIMNIIQPHITRVEKIFIQAKHGSSLPLVSSGVFSRIGALFKELKLECASYKTTQSSPTTPPSLPSSEMVEPVYAPLNLTLHGPTFLDACSVSEFWTNQFSSDRNTSLNISHLKTGPSFTAYEFLNAICHAQKIQYLTLEDVEFHPSNWIRDPDKDELYDPGLDRSMEEISFISMDTTTIIPFIEELLLERLRLDNCRLNGLRYPISYKLYLKNIAEDQNIADAIISSNPHEVFISNCPGFNDSMLAALCDQQKSSEGVICYSLHALTIKGTTKITKRGLKKFIRGRRKIGYHFTDYLSLAEIETRIQNNQPSAMQSLTIIGGGYKFSAKDIDFFCREYVQFQWVP